MALKRKVTKEDFDKFDDKMKALYVMDGDNYKLDLDDDDTGALKRAKDREAQLRKEAELKLKELENKLEEMEGNDARKKGDIATLEKSWQKKLDDQKNSYEERVGKLSAHTTKTLVDNVALSIATKISNSPALMLPHIKSRLIADFEGDEPKTRILDREGKPSALTVGELENELLADKTFAPILLATRASGGAQRPNIGSAGHSTSEPVDLAKMHGRDLAEYLKASKAQS